MLGDDGLRVAVPSKGRLREPALGLLREAGLRFRVSERRLFAVCSETGTRILFCATPDIPVLLAEGAVDLGITGSDQVQEKGVEVIEHFRLGFGRCRLSVAVHKDAPYRAVEELAGRVVGSKFLRLARGFFEERGVAHVHVLELQGAVEVMVLLGLVDAIVEIVQTGQSLLENDLVELAAILPAEAVLVGSARPRLPEARDRLLRRVEGVLVAARWSLVEFNCPADRIDDAARIAPGYSSPTVQATKDQRWLAVKVMVEKEHIHRILDELEKLGCRAIFETDLRHARL